MGAIINDLLISNSRNVWILEFNSNIATVLLFLTLILEQLKQENLEKLFQMLLV